MRPRVLLAKNEKAPATSGSWKISENEAEVNLWISQGYNVGLVTTGVTVVDLDDEELAREFWRKYSGIISVASKTRRGIHVFFAGEIPTRKGDRKDWKSGAGSYVVIPPSIVDGVRRRMIRGDIDTTELPPLPEELKPPPDRGITRKVRDAVRYVMSIESIQGVDGSKGLVRACAVLRDGGFSESQAMAILMEWNLRAIPPWTVDELARACTNTYKKK